MKNLFADLLNLTQVEGEVGEGQRIPASSINKQGRCRVIFSNVFFSSFTMKRAPKPSGAAFRKRRKEEEEKLAQIRGM